MNNQIDVKDKKIMYYLSVNARESDSRIAKNVELSRAAVTYRVKRLEKLGISRKYLTWIDTFQLGYNNFHVYLKLKDFNLEKKRRIINIIKNNPNIKYLVSTAWEYDFFFVISAKNLQDLDAKLKDLYSEFEEDIKNTKLYIVDSILKENPPYYSDFIKFQKSHESINLKEEIKLDKLDIKIMNYLSENARINIIDIVNKLKKESKSITAEAISYRIKRLNKIGLIKKYSIDLDYGKLGFIWFMLVFKLNKIDKNFNEKIKQAFGNRDEIVYIDKTTDHRIRFQILLNKTEQISEEIGFISSIFGDSIEDYEVLLLLDQYVLTTMPEAIYVDLLKSAKK